MNLTVKQLALGGITVLFVLSGLGLFVREVMRQPKQPPAKLPSGNYAIPTLPGKATPPTLVP